MQKQNTVYDYIVAEENNYLLPIQVIDSWEWSMKEHISTAIRYKNSTYKNGKDENKPFKNIILAILRVQYRAEGFDVKDIELFVDEAKNYYKSFLLRKYHEKWAREHDLDTFIDDMVESYCDYGGTLVKKINKAVPEVVPMQSIAFCDQTDILSGPIGIKHFFSSDQLKEMEKAGWGDKANGANVTVDELITLANNEQDKVKDKVQGQTSHTPGKYIEVYEVHGIMPKKYLDDGNDYEETEYANQIQIVAYYTDTKKGQRKGSTLFAKEEKESPFKLILRDKIFGRALGLGGVEELEEAQVWTNFATIREKELLDSASKTVHYTDDEGFEERNVLTDLDNGEVIKIGEGRKISQLDTTPKSSGIFDNSEAKWEVQARSTGAAQEAIMGDQPPSGTPFKSVEFQAAESHSLHEYRKGKIATFLDEIYRDWIIPYIAKEITKEQGFLAELDLAEMQDIKEMVAITTANKLINKRRLAGVSISTEEVEALKEKTRADFTKGGSKKFIKILKGEMSDAAVSVRTNIVGKQEYLSRRVDKLVNIFRQIMVNPQFLQIPALAKTFNSILEGSGMSPIDFSELKLPPPQQQLPQQEAPQPPSPEESQLPNPAAGLPQIT